MITTEKMTPAADAAGARYQTLVDAWQRIYTEALDNPAFGAGSVFERAQDQAYEVARDYLAAEQERIGDAIGEIVSEALSDAHRALSVEHAHELPGPAGELLSATQGYLLREISIQIERDIAALLQGLRNTAIQVSLMARAKGLSPRAALMQHRIGSNESLAFHFRDRRNAKWHSRLFIRSVWRQALLSVFNEITLCVLADHGIETAEVFHAHAKAGVHGQELAISANTALPTYGEVRGEIFHPNAEAILTVPARFRSQP